MGRDSTHVFFVQVRLSVFFTLQRLPIDFLVITFLRLHPADCLTVVVKTLKLVLQTRLQVAARDAGHRTQALVGIDPREPGAQWARARTDRSRFWTQRISKQTSPILDGAICRDVGVKRQLPCRRLGKPDGSKRVVLGSMLHAGAIGGIGAAALSSILKSRGGTGS